MKDTAKDIVTEKEELSTESPLSASAKELFFEHPDITHLVVSNSVLKKDRSERLDMALNEICIGQRIKKVLKEQGRSVSWLAKQLCMERSGLYYVFRQNFIDIEQLLRISYFLDYNFMQDVSDVYMAYGL